MCISFSINCDVIFSVFLTFFRTYHEWISICLWMNYQFCLSSCRESRRWMVGNIGWGCELISMRSSHEPPPCVVYFPLLVVHSWRWRGRWHLLTRVTHTAWGRVRWRKSLSCKEYFNLIDVNIFHTSVTIFVNKTCLEVCCYKSFSS